MGQVVIAAGAGSIGVTQTTGSHRRHRVVVYGRLERKGCVTNLEWLRSHPRSENLEVLAGDLRLPTPALEREVEVSEASFHMAAQVAVTSSVTDSVADVEVNAMGT